MSAIAPPSTRRTSVSKPSVPKVGGAIGAMHKPSKACAQRAPGHGDTALRVVRPCSTALERPTTSPRRRGALHLRHVVTASASRTRWTAGRSAATGWMHVRRWWTVARVRRRVRPPTFAPRPLRPCHLPHALGRADCAFAAYGRASASRVASATATPPLPAPRRRRRHAPRYRKSPTRRHPHALRPKVVPSARPVPRQREDATAAKPVAVLVRHRHEAAGRNVATGCRPRAPDHRTCWNRPLTPATASPLAAALHLERSMLAFPVVSGAVRSGLCKLEKGADAPRKPPAQVHRQPVLPSIMHVTFESGRALILPSSLRRNPPPFAVPLAPPRVVLMASNITVSRPSAAPESRIRIGTIFRCASSAVRHLPPMKPFYGHPARLRHTVRFLGCPCCCLSHPVHREIARCDSHCRRAEMCIGTAKVFAVSAGGLAEAGNFSSVADVHRLCPSSASRLTRRLLLPTQHLVHTRRHRHLRPAKKMKKRAVTRCRRW